MAQSLEDLKRQLRERLTELKPLVAEYEQLERAAGALGVDGGSVTPSKTPKRRSATAKPRARAPRGANKAAVTAVIAERPGVTVSEIAEATGIARPLIYNTTRTGIAQGDIEPVDLSGGRKGYKLAAVEATPTPEVMPSVEGTADVDADTTADSSVPSTAKSSRKRTRKRPSKRKSEVDDDRAGDETNNVGDEAPADD